MSKVKTRIKHTISANTLFHFTNSADDLLNILRNEFRPHYCLKDWNLKGPVDLLKELPKGVRKNEILLGEQAVPMVCFCDIPLLNVTEHLNFYGD